MTQDELKALAGRAAAEYVLPGTIVGVGTGSTVNHFIDALARMGQRVAGAVSSSQASTARLSTLGIKIVDANDVESLAVYIDGADEINHQGYMIKGGGAALTREKVIAEMAQRFICIADESKLVQTLGAFPLPVEVVPMAAKLVARRLAALGSKPTLREGVVTDNGGQILDVRGLAITDPVAMELEINQWPGVITVGIFARNKACVCLLATSQGVRALDF